MKRLLVMLAGLAAGPCWGQALVANHAIVADYAIIPPRYLARVKAMWANIPGESHSLGVRLGCRLLAEQEPTYAVNAQESGTPAGPTDAHLRINRASWGDVSHSTGWRYGYGEEDWYTSATAIARTKAHLDYAHANGNPIAAMGFGWCWDMTWHNNPGGTVDPVYQVKWAGASVGGPEGDLRWGLDAADQELTANSVCMDTYLSATQQYIDYCASMGYATVVFFTTGAIDGSSGENAYQRFLKHEHIRNYVKAGPVRVLFDYADILSWSDAGQPGTQSWTDLGGVPRTFPYIHSDNMLDRSGGYAEDGDHIGERGAIRLAKALWWMLARTAGWDGTPHTSQSVPHHWLDLHGLVTEGRYEEAALSDTDEDGSPAWEEFYAGTDPRVKASVLRLMDDLPAGHLRWTSGAVGQADHFTVERCTDLKLGDWSAVASVPWPEATEHTWTDPEAGALPGRVFYRVRVPMD